MAVPPKTRSRARTRALLLRLAHGLLWVFLIGAAAVATFTLPGSGMFASATPTAENTGQLPAWVLTPPFPPQPTEEFSGPPPTPTYPPLTLPPLNGDAPPVLYTTQAGDSLAVLAKRFGVLPEEITSPTAIKSQGFMDPGQLLVIPDKLGETTDPRALFPDSEVVFSPSAVEFDVQAYVEEAGGYLSTYTEWLNSTHSTTGAEIIVRVAKENSVNPRLLLSLLEYQSGWVHGQPSNLSKEQYPLGLVDYESRGLYKQLAWAMRQISVGYYAYREGRLLNLTFSDGSTQRIAPELNAGTAALQYFFAKVYAGQTWEQALSLEIGLPALHQAMFGNPWLRAQTVEPLFPASLSQPDLILPFLRGQMWAYTGGPHGAWERDGAWAALDFAPGSSAPGCTESQAIVTAMASGLVVRSERGIVVIDLDSDGYEQTGWAIMYLHIATKDRIAIGTLVEQGDWLGHPSCEGGVSTGTHVHIARKYNGEWIPADGPLPFNLGGWVAASDGVIYKGTLTRGEEVVRSSDTGAFYSRIYRLEGDL